ncbi:MAG TPA: AAA family ATPase, partial [Acidimicrobiales bacterium]|nr:AAA family ATPase [Acidimicrobiales bacterium]
MDIFGRDEVLRACETALRSTFEGQGRVVLMSGEAGMGKTTVARAVTADAAARGAVVRWAGCWDGPVVPLAPWIELLGALGGDECAQVSAQLLDGSGDLGAEPGSLELARLRLFSQVAAALRRSADSCPQVVVIDDLHWADAASIELLRTIAAQVSTMRLLLIGTYRDDEVTAEHAVSVIGGAVDRIELHGLDHVDVDRVLGATFGQRFSPDETAEVARRTGGNPLLIGHLGRLLASGAPLGVPAGARDVLDRRLARLPSACSEVLGVAAVLGIEFDPTIVAAMTETEVDAVFTALDPATVARIAQPLPEQPWRWSFSHALLQAARYTSLSSAERAALHRRACEVLDARGRTSAATLAHHGLRGSFDAADLRPARYALAAADEARGRFGIEEAATLYEAALDRSPDSPEGDRLRVRILIGLGETRLRTADAVGAAESFNAAASLARKQGDAEALAHAALGFGSGLGGFEIRLLDPRQIALLEEAAGALDPASPLRPWVLARLSVALSFLGSEDRRVALADEALALARSLNAPAATAAALASRCDAISGPTFAAERSGLASEITSIGLRLGDPRLELLGRRLRVMALAELCDIDGLDVEIAAYERSAAALGDPLYLWYAPLWRAMRSVAQGDLDDARRCCDEAAAMGAEAGSGNSQVLTLVVEIFLAFESGDMEDFRSRVEVVASTLPELLLPNSVPMMVFTDRVVDAAGWRARAADVLAAVDDMPIDAEWLCTVAPLTELVDALGAPDAAADLYARFAPY